ncbi:MAG: hypothetical protein QME65_04410, partial [Candidatus Omnitrophota bacterium]|nr:hypothetical protein [Candidatus Omnitrophota bacterium]
MIKVIISYASAGAGHFKAAQAIYDYLKEERSDLEIKIIDALKHSTLALKVSYAFGYPFLVKYLQGIWRALFWVTQVKSFRPLTRGVIASLNRANTRAFAGFLIKENPGYIIST